MLSAEPDATTMGDDGAKLHHEREDRMGIDYHSLSIAERIQLVQEILDSIADEMGSRAVPPWQMRELDRRLEDIEKNPRDAQSWEEVKAEVLSEQAPTPSE